MDKAALKIDIQRRYWTFDAKEKEALLARGADSLSWGEKLRLLHLCCLELATPEEVMAELESKRPPQGAPEGEARELCRKLAADLLSKRSPYRARYCQLWQGERGRGRRPETEGLLMNASVTHLGCLEVIRLDEDLRPEELAFVPFDDLRGVLYGPLALFRGAKLFYDDGRPDEVVLVPLLYGISWRTGRECDRDGSLTRFVCHLPVEPLDRQLGIGVGHQDLLLMPRAGAEQRADSLMGVGSVSEISMALELDDPEFDAKCRARGLDPAEARRKLGR